MFNRFIYTLSTSSILIFLLIGCDTLTKPGYAEPEGNDLPVVHNVTKSSIYSTAGWDKYTLRSVDNMLVDYSESHRDPEKLLEQQAVETKTATRISVGKHDLIIDVTFYRGERSGPFVAKIPLKLIAEQNR
jgi:7,8-dihydro-6-hydroxymethylpterin-pyrophosphokinase